MSFYVIMQDNAIVLLFLHLESLRKLYVFHWLCFEIYAGHISFSVIYKILRAIAGFFFRKRFRIIYFCRIIYSFAVIFIYKWFNIWTSFWIPLNFSKIYCNSYSILKTFIICIFQIYCCFFLFYPVWRISIWTTTFKIYLLTFLIQQLNWIKSKITSSHWCF